MVSRQGGALRSDDIGDPGHETGNEIQLTLANNGALGVEQRSLGLIQTEHHLALGENRAFGRVDVFSGFFVAREDAPAKADDTTLFVADGEHESSAKTVVAMLGALFPHDQPGLFQEVGSEALAAAPINGVVPQVGGVTETEEFNGLLRHTAFGEVIAGDLPSGIVGQGSLPALGDLLVNGEELILDVAGLLGAGLLVEFQGNMSPFGQAPHGVQKPDVLVFLQKSEDAAADPAAKAIKELLVRVDVETG